MPRIDQEQFEMLVETGEGAAAELLHELLDLFQAEAEPRQKNLEAALTTEDRPALVRHAHALAGSSANLGAQRLWKVCKILEESASTATWRDLKEVQHVLCEEYEATVREYQEQIAQLGA